MYSFNEVIEARTTDGKYFATIRAISNAANINVHVGNTIIIKRNERSL